MVEKLKTDKKVLHESYLGESVCLKDANKVISELLLKYQQHVQSVPMLTKRPSFPTQDLYKTALGRSNPLYLKIAQQCHPALYNGHVLLDPTYIHNVVHDSEETLVQAEVTRTKMFEKMKEPIAVEHRQVITEPVNYAKINSLYSHFVPQKKLSREQVYWLPTEEIASYNSNQSKPVTEFVRTRPTKSQVKAQLQMLKACFLEFNKVVKTRTTPSALTHGEWRFEHTKRCFVEGIIPFYEKLKKYVNDIEDNLFKEITEFIKIFDELDKEYDQCFNDKKSFEVEKKNRLIENECLIIDSMYKELCSTMLSSDVDMPMIAELRSNCIKEHSQNMELEAKFLKTCLTQHVVKVVILTTQVLAQAFKESLVSHPQTGPGRNTEDGVSVMEVAFGGDCGGWRGGRRLAGFLSEKIGGDGGNFVSIRNMYCLLVRTITAWLSINQSIQIMTSKLPSPMGIKAMLKGVSKGLRCNLIACKDGGSVVEVAFGGDCGGWRGGRRLAGFLPKKMGGDGGVSVG
nr:hypothetical protein [Tanacetum cinerariifolium]